MVDGSRHGSVPPLFNIYLFNILLDCIILFVLYFLDFMASLAVFTEDLRPKISVSFYMLLLYLYIFISNSLVQGVIFQLRMRDGSMVCTVRG